MALIESSNQFRYTSKGPVDSKMLVKTYNELLDTATWTTSTGSIVAYNGMIVSVWLNKDDATKNGVYYLFDPNCNTTLKKPDVTLDDNWHKLDGSADITEYIERIQAIESRLDSIEEELEKDHTHSYGYRSDFPTIGELNHIYIANDQKRTYIYTSEGYLPIADQFDMTDHDNNPETADVRIIYGGSAN